MMNSFALQNIINLTQGPGTASHPGRTSDGPGFLMFLAMEQLAAEQASIPSDAFSPDSDGQIVRALGNGQMIDLTKVTTAPESSIKHPAPSIQHQAFSIKHPVSSIQHPASSTKHPASSIQHQVPSPKSHISSLISQVSCLMPCVYPLTDQVAKGDITLSQATEDVHWLDASLMNASADMRTAPKIQALRHTSYVMRHGQDATQPSVVHITSQPETIKRVVQTPLPDQPFPQVKQTTVHGSSLMNAGADIRALRHTSYVMRHRHDVSQPSVVHVAASQPGTIERVVQTSPPDQLFLRFEPTTDHGSPITDYGSRNHDVIYTNAREVLPRSLVLRPEVVPDDITESPHVVVLSKAPAEKQIFYANPKLDAPDLWAKVAGSVEEKNPGGVITSVKHDSGYAEENSEVSLQVKGTSEVYRQPETEHAPRADASQVKPSIQVQKVFYISSGKGELEQREIGEMGGRPVISDVTYSRSGSPADEVMKAPVSEDNHGSSEPQLKIAAGDYRPTHQIEATIDTSSRGMGDFPHSSRGMGDFPHRQIFQHVFREQGSPELSLQDNGVRFDTLSSSAFMGKIPHTPGRKETSVVEKVQASQQREIIPQTPREYVRIEDNIQEIQPELAGEKNVDRIQQPLRQEINPQDIQGYVKHPQLNDEVRGETQYAAASLDAFEGASVDGKLQESHSQQIIPEIPQEPVRIESNVQEIQPEPVANEKIDRIYQPLRQEIRPQDVKQYAKHSEPNDDAKIEMRYETAPSHVFEGVSVAEKVQKSPPQEITPQAPREYVRIESNIQEVQPELVAEKNVDRIYQPLRQEISPQDVQEYGKHPELNEETKIETRREAALPDAFEVGSSPHEKVQKSQPQAVILQATQESVRARDDVQEIQPELSKNKEIGRIQQLVQQELDSQNVQNYGKNPQFRVESQPYSKEIQATASVPELHVEGTSTLQDKIPFYVSKIVAGERSEAIWIQLEPENLGKVKIRVLLRDNKIAVNLSVNRPETKGIIELQVPGIRRSLAQHEISVTEFRVSLENGFSNSNPRYSNLLHDDANTNSRPAYERGDWNGNQSKHSNRRRYYRNDSLVDLFA